MDLVSVATRQDHAVVLALRSGLLHEAVEVALAEPAAEVGDGGGKGAEDGG
jgi:hypothetical protein